MNASPMTIFKRLRLVAAWCLGAYFAWMYVRMGWVKFDPDGFWTVAFQRWGYPVWLRWLVGVIEVVGGILILVPWAASYGALAVGVVMVGALMTRLGDARYVDVAWIAAYTIGLLWIAFEWWPYRRPRRGRNDSRSAPV